MPISATAPINKLLEDHMIVNGESVFWKCLVCRCPAAFHTPVAFLLLLFNSSFLLEPTYWISGLICHQHPGWHCKNVLPGIRLVTQDLWDLSIHLTCPTANSLNCWQLCARQTWVWNLEKESLFVETDSHSDFALMNLTKTARSKSKGQVLMQKNLNCLNFLY